MNRGLYIGATSLITNQRRMEVLANNLSNINTTGFKKDISISESFPEKLMIKKTRRPEFRNRNPEDNFTYNTIESGGEVAHRAKIKEGFFRMETPLGKSHVKEIEVIVDDEGYLKTKYINLDGESRTNGEYYLLDRNGNRIRNPENIEAVLEENIYHPRNYVVGTMSRGVNFKRVHTDFTQGGIIDTNGKFDIALLGDGFFKLQGDEEGEILYTRNGSFTLDTDNYLVDLDGRRVLGTNGPIRIEGSEVNISEDGVISVDGNNVGNLDVVTIENSEFLRKVGENNFRMATIINPETGEEELIEAEEGVSDARILQGHLETSNMNAVDGMVEMITLLRDFEANQKVVRMQDEMLEKAATEIGRV